VVSALRGLAHDGRRVSESLTGSCESSIRFRVGAHFGSRYRGSRRRTVPCEDWIVVSALRGLAHNGRRVSESLTGSCESSIRFRVDALPRSLRGSRRWTVPCEDWIVVGALRGLTHDGRRVSESLTDSCESSIRFLVVARRCSFVCCANCRATSCGGFPGRPNLMYLAQITRSGECAVPELVGCLLCLRTNNLHVSDQKGRTYRLSLRL
jgi:hypothetical protein